MEPTTPVGSSESQVDEVFDAVAFNYERRLYEVYGEVRQLARLAELGTLASVFIN